MDPKLRMVGGPDPGQVIAVPHGMLLVGRAKDCDVRLESQFVSQHHCEILLDDDALRLRDLESKNGTAVNGRLIGTGMRILLHLTPSQDESS
jgi:pSer/pThr/pTyr-binding forkhead associated (FHA) protein